MAASTEVPAENSVPREGLIDTAVRFLTNPNVIDRPFQQKQTFLKSKGLTDEEVRIACERVNLSPSYVAPRPQDAVIPVYPFPQHVVASEPRSTWIRLKDILHTLALLGGLGYVIFWIYKAYIEPFLFGRPKPKKSTAESLSSIEKAIDNVSRSTTELKAELHTELSRISQERESGAVRNLADIKSDIATVKGLLLSRQQFPSAPNSNSFRTLQSSKPSIPVWQMSTEQKNGVKDDEDENSVRDTQNSNLNEKPHDDISASMSSEDSAIKSDLEKESVNSPVAFKEHNVPHDSVDGSVHNGSGTHVSVDSE